MPRIIAQKGESTLIELTDGGVLRRVIVPTSTVADNAVSAEVLGYGVAFGLPWDELWSPKVTPAAVANELRKRGIWTLADLRAQPMVVVAALQAAYGLDVAAIAAAAEKYERQEIDHE